MAIETDDFEKSYELHELNINPNWEFFDNPDEENSEIASKIPVKMSEDLELDSDILEYHENFLNDSILLSEYDTSGLKCINISEFSGYIQSDKRGMFPDGISMSLWRADKIMFIFGVSGPVSFIGLLEEKSGEYGDVYGELSIEDELAPRLNIPLRFYFLNKKQEFVDLFEKWAEAVKKESETVKSDRYHVLTNYKLNGLGSIRAWKEIEELQNPLLYIITQYMHYYLGKASFPEKKSRLNEWIEDNTIIPRVG